MAFQNFKRVERIWRREGLKVPHKQPKKRRLWLNDGSCIRLRPEYRNHVWAYDFVQDRTWDGKAFKMLTIVDEFSRECLAIEVDCKLNSQNVLETLTELFVRRGPGEIFYTLKETQILIEQWRTHYNTIKPHSSLGYRPPAPVTMTCKGPFDLKPEVVLN